MTIPLSWIITKVTEYRPLMKEKQDSQTYISIRDAFFRSVSLNFTPLK